MYLPISTSTQVFKNLYVNGITMIHVNLNKWTLPNILHKSFWLSKFPTIRGHNKLYHVTSEDAGCKFQLS